MNPKYNDMNRKNVKRSLLLAVALTLSCTALAQTSPKAKARVAEIRKLYAETKERMAYNDQEDYPAVSGMETTYYYMAPGAGPIKHYVKYYVETEETDHEGGLRFTPYFFSDSYNSGARRIYEEYMLDDKTGTLLFAYAYEENGDNTKNEGRYYYYKDGTLAHKEEHVNTEWGTFISDKYVKTRAANLKKAFHHTMN